MAGKVPKNLEEYEVEIRRFFQKEKVKAISPYDACRQLGIVVKRGTGQPGRPRS